ncbi:MAG: thermonuclease family protein [Porticoccus sp.]|nr:thermonuclease family protein [Porticoccus sp.]
MSGRYFICLLLTLVVGCSEDKSTNRLDNHQPQHAKQQDAQQPSSPEYLKPCPIISKTETVKVSSVYDGDTLALSDGRKVRLIGINATEMGQKEQSPQPYALQARDAVRAFVKDSNRIELLLDVETKDHYGRWLGHIYNETEENLEQFLLRQGLAYHVAIPPNLSLAPCLAQAEQFAQKHQLGLWGDKVLPPVKAELIHQGGFQRVQGKVTAIHTGKHWRLEIEDNRFTVMLYSEHQHRFTQAWLKSLLGKHIEVQGWVYKVKGQWRIKLETPYGIEVL